MRHKEEELKELLSALSEQTLEEKVIALHRISCRKYIKDMDFEELKEIALEISNIAQEYPIHEMTRGNTKKRFRLTKVPEKEFSGLELAAWLFEICSNLAKKMRIELLI